MRKIVKRSARDERVVSKKVRASSDERHIKPIGDILTKVQTYDAIVDALAGDEKIAVTRKQVARVIGAYNDVIMGQLVPGGAGKAKLIDLGIAVTRKIKAKKGGQKVMSFGEERITKDKPATVRLKIRPTIKVRRAVIPSKLLALMDAAKAAAKKKNARTAAKAGAKPGKTKKRVAR